MRRAAWAMLVTAAAGATAQQPAPRTIQQDFDAATALSQGKDPAAALAAWDALLARATKSARTRAVVQARRAALLWQLGREDQAQIAADAALAGLPATDASLRDDRFATLMTIGRVARSTLDYAGAADAFAKAEVLAEAAEPKLVALNVLIEVQTFVDPAAARQALARADQLLAANKVDETSQAIFARRRGLLAINAGDWPTAIAETQRAVKLLGGLTSKTDSIDVSARADAALALILAKQPDRAREYLAFTGAGRLPKTSFDPAGNMVVPDCGGEVGLKPADLAVIEFTLGDDGVVVHAAPIYAAGGPRVGLEFARAAGAWSWSPEQVRELPTFYRTNVRVEMRCSTGFERPSVQTLLDQEVVSWLEGKGLDLPDRPANDAAAAPAQRAALIAAEAREGRDSIRIMPALLAVQRNSITGREDVHDLSARALAIARANGASPRAQLSFAVTERLTATPAGDYAGMERSLRPLLADPVLAADAQARSALRLMIADYLKGDEGTALVRQVAADPALKADDPTKVGALVRLASREQTAGQVAAARASFEAAGVAADQCALLDAPPKMTGYNVSFPDEALRWGFEGWTQTQFDVDAAGKVANERTILSYPAFVFSQSGTAMMRGAKFTKSYRPDGKLGCGSLTKRIRFTMRP